MLILQVVTDAALIVGIALGCFILGAIIGWSARSAMR
jgi:hypothetical protein